MCEDSFLRLWNLNSVKTIVALDIYFLLLFVLFSLHLHTPPPHSQLAPPPLHSPPPPTWQTIATSEGAGVWGGSHVDLGKLQALVGKQLG